MTSAHLLNAAGTLLYGPLWQSELARATGTNLRTMQRWAKGEFEPRNPNLWRDLSSLLEQRQTAIAEMRGNVRRHLNHHFVGKADIAAVRKRFPG